MPKQISLTHRSLATPIRDTSSHILITYPEMYIFMQTLVTMMQGNKIRTIRELRGYSQDYVAAKLEIAQNTYSKLETNQTKMTTEMLEKIAAILEVSINDILSEEPIVLNFYGINHGAQGKFDLIEHFHAGQKELYEKMLSNKDEEINRLNNIIENLLSKT
jgi:transcriptional regulator with XRE-family HTH domain